MTSPDLNGLTCLVTGATNGIGKASAMALACLGAEVIVLARDPKKGEQTLAEIGAACGHSKLSFVACDLSSLTQIRDAAQSILEREQPLHVLLNNAAVLNKERRLSPDGIEQTWAVNHLAYVLLTELLLERLKASAPARVVNVSSGAYAFVKGMAWDDLQFEQRPYKMMEAYAQSKLANLLYTQELARRLEGTQVTANALHPGGVRTGLGQQNDAPLLKFLSKFITPFLTTPEKGARTSVYLCSSPEVEGQSGLYWERSRPRTLKPFARDPEAARRLWEISLQQLQGAGIDLE